MRVRSVIHKLRTQILEAAAANGAHHVRVFGSIARGEDRDGSDVDLLVSLDQGRTLLDLARLEVHLEHLLGRRVDVVTEESLQEPMRAAALRDAIRV